MQWTKPDHIVTSLSQEITTEVRDLILKPPTNDPCDIKAKLIEHTPISEQWQLQQLFNTEELWD